MATENTQLGELPDAGEPQDVSAMEKLLEGAGVPEETGHDDLTIEDGKPKDEPPAKTDDTPAGDKKGADDKTPAGDQKSEDGKSGEEGKDEDDKKDGDGDKPKEDEVDDFDQKIEQIKLRNGATEKSQTALNVLKNYAKEEHNKVKELKGKLNEVETQLKTANPLTPELEKELGDLRQLRETVDLENDPKFNQQYTQRIAQYENATLGKLREWKLPDSAAKYIYEHGGVLKFRASNDFMPATFKNDDGSQMTHAQWWDKFVYSRMTTPQKEEIGDHLAALRQLNRAKDMAIQSAKANKDVYLKQRQEAAQKESEDWNNRIQTHATKVLKDFGAIAEKKEMPKNPTPEQKAAVEKHNANYEKAQKLAAKYVTEITPENLTEAAIGAAYSLIAKDELKESQKREEAQAARIAELEKQISDIKSAGKTSHKQTTGKTVTAVAAPKVRDDEDAMTQLINQTDKQAAA